MMMNVSDIHSDKLDGSSDKLVGSGTELDE